MSLQQLVARRFAFGKQVHHAEAARIGVDDAGAVIEGEHHMIVGAIAVFAAPVLEIEFAEIARRGPSAAAR